jgi:hypothetical protein
LYLVDQEEQQVRVVLEEMVHMEAEALAEPAVGLWEAQVELARYVLVQQGLQTMGPQNLFKVEMEADLMQD